MKRCGRAPERTVATQVGTTQARCSQLSLSTRSTAGMRGSHSILSHRDARLRWSFPFKPSRPALPIHPVQWVGCKPGAASWERGAAFLFAEVDLAADNVQARASDSKGRVILPLGDAAFSFLGSGLFRCRGSRQFHGWQGFGNGGRPAHAGAAGDGPLSHARRGGPWGERGPLRGRILPPPFALLAQGKEWLSILDAVFRAF